MPVVGPTLTSCLYLPVTEGQGPDHIEYSKSTDVTEANKTCSVLQGSAGGEATEDGDKEGCSGARRSRSTTPYIRRMPAIASQSGIGGGIVTSVSH